MNSRARAYRVRGRGAGQLPFRSGGGKGPGYTARSRRRATTRRSSTTSRTIAARRTASCCSSMRAASRTATPRDVTRTFPVGARFTPRAARVYEIVLARADGGDRGGASRARRFDERRTSARVDALVEGLIALGLLEGRVDEVIEERALPAFYMHRTEPLARHGRARRRRLLTRRRAARARARAWCSRSSPASTSRADARRSTRR